jgi:hypothetical protein
MWEAIIVPVKSRRGEAFATCEALEASSTSVSSPDAYSDPLQSLSTPQARGANQSTLRVSGMLSNIHD